MNARYRYVIVLLALAGNLAAIGLARYGYGAILPFMQQDLGFNNLNAGLLATANLTGYLIMAVVGGAMVSRFGARRVAPLGLFAVAVGMALTGLSQTLPQVAATRFLAGLGSGAANMACMGVLTAWFVSRERGLATGIAITGSSISLIFMGPMAPRLVESFGADGWRVSWFIFAIITLFAGLAAALFLHDRPRDDTAAMTDSHASPSADWRDIYLSKRVWLLGIIYFTFGFAYIIYMTFFTRHLIADDHYTPKAAGMLFMVLGWASLPCPMLAGFLSDRLGRRAALILFYGIQAVGLALFGISHSYAGHIISALIVGITLFGAPTIMAAAAGDLLGYRLGPAGLGFITLFFGIGQALSPALAGTIAGESSFSAAFVLAGAVSLLGAVISLALKMPRSANG